MIFLICLNLAYSGLAKEIAANAIRPAAHRSGADDLYGEEKYREFLREGF
jgi:hypothetical protein